MHGPGYRNVMETILYSLQENGLPDIVSNPEIMFGMPRIAGSRITVNLLLDKLAAGETPEGLALAYPHIPPGSVTSAVKYAAAILRNEVAVPLARRSA